MPKLSPQAEHRIAMRLKELIYSTPELDPFNPAHDWAARLCLHYWRTYEDLHYHIPRKKTHLTSPETLLRVARKYNLTPTKSEGFPLPEVTDNSVDNYI